jgi:hypothetical protein
MLVVRRSNLVVALDPQGQQVGTLREFRQSFFKRATGLSAFAERQLQVVDGQGRPILTLRIPFTVLRPKIELVTPDGVEVGRIVRWYGVLDEGFGLIWGGKKVGSFRDADGKFREFVVGDDAANEIGRMKKQRAGGGYTVELPNPIESNLRLLVVAAAMTHIDRVRQLRAQEKAMKRRSRGGDDGGSWGDGDW